VNDLDMVRGNVSHMLDHSTTTHDFMGPDATPLNNKRRVQKRGVACSCVVTHLDQHGVMRGERQERLGSKLRLGDGRCSDNKRARRNPGPLVQVRRVTTDTLIAISYIPAAVIIPMLRLFNEL